MTIIMTLQHGRAPHRQPQCKSEPGHPIAGRGTSGTRQSLHLVQRAKIEAASQQPVNRGGTEMPAGSIVRGKIQVRSNIWRGRT